MMERVVDVFRVDERARRRHLQGGWTYLRRILCFISMAHYPATPNWVVRHYQVGINRPVVLAAGRVVIGRSSKVRRNNDY